MRILTFDDAEPLRFLTQGNRPVLVDSFVKWRIADVRQYYVSVQVDDFRAATRIACGARATPRRRRSTPRPSTRTRSSSPSTAAWRPTATPSAAATTSW